MASMQGPPRYDDTTQRLTVAPPPPTVPPARRSRRGGDGGWSPGSFSPAIFIVALVVILVLAGTAFLNRRGSGAPPPATATTGATTVATATSQPGSGNAPTGKVFIVGNTGGEGVYLRKSPNLNDKDRAYVDGTRLEQIGPDTTAGGTTWRHVRAPDGRTGWVPAQYTTEAR